MHGIIVDVVQRCLDRRWSVQVAVKAWTLLPEPKTGRARSFTDRQPFQQGTVCLRQQLLDLFGNRFREVAPGAALFQRSSSCLEGRNGQLSLRHRGLHRLTARKLGALRVFHNYLAERPDGTTAAERFFGARPQPLLPRLLSRLPLPAHPRQRRDEA